MEPVEDDRSRGALRLGSAAQGPRQGWGLRGSGRVVTVVLLLLVGFAAGRWSLGPTTVSAGGQATALSWVDLLPWSSGPDDPRLVQAADPRELIPLPGPGPTPGEGEAVPAECLLAMPDGQLFALPQPGQGDLGQGGGTPELIPLIPVPAPGPAQPAPQAPSPQQGPPPGTLRM